MCRWLWIHCAPRHHRGKQQAAGSRNPQPGFSVSHKGRCIVQPSLPVHAMGRYTQACCRYAELKPAPDQSSQRQLVVCTGEQGRMLRAQSHLGGSPLGTLQPKGDTQTGHCTLGGARGWLHGLSELLLACTRARLTCLTSLLAHPKQPSESKLSAYAPNSTRV